MACGINAMKGMGWLMGLEPSFAKNLLKPAPALTFAFSSRLKNMVKVDDLSG
jgi:hypothetical protein